MDQVTPETAEQLAETLRECAAAKRSIALGGGFSKQRMGGPPVEGTRVSAKGLRRVLQYEAQDLTISVEAGLPWRELQRVLAENRQMVPLDPPLFDTATVGGVIATNCSGPRRRLYGSARDLVIGMKFATLEGKLIQTGGMVVKNVAGLDMGKLLIGSYGTLASIAVVNFKVSPAPPYSRTFLTSHQTAEMALAARDRLLQGVLQPVAVDLLNPPAASSIGLEGWTLALQASGNAKVVERWEREMPGAAALRGEEETALWERVREFTPRFIERHSDAAVARVSVSLRDVAEVVTRTDQPLVARAGTGVVYVHFVEAAHAVQWLQEGISYGWAGVLEWVSQRPIPAEQQWPNPGSGFETMRRIKTMFDAGGLLNRGRLYGRI
jgi:glycolate oxidase FAD binding subunit